MKKPHKGFTPPDFSGQSQILFCNEGNPVAMVITNGAGRRRITSMKFAKAEAALAWCRLHGATMVYHPIAPARN
jgi:hypothetical protein